MNIYFDIPNINLKVNFLRHINFFFKLKETYNKLLLILKF